MEFIPVKFMCKVTALSPWATFYYTFVSGNQRLTALVIYDAMTMDQAEAQLAPSLQDALDIANAALAQHNLKLYV